MHLNPPMVPVCQKQAMGEGRTHIKPVDYEQRMVYWGQYGKLELALRKREPNCNERRGTNRDQLSQGFQVELEKCEKAQYEVDAWVCEACYSLNGKYVEVCVCGNLAVHAAMRQQAKLQNCAMVEGCMQYLDRTQDFQGFKKARLFVQEALKKALLVGDQDEIRAYTDRLAAIDELSKQQSEKKQQQVDDSHEGPIEMQLDVEFEKVQEQIEAAIEAKEAVSTQDEFDFQRAQKPSLWQRIKGKLYDAKVSVLREEYRQKVEEPTWYAFCASGIKGARITSGGVISVMTTCMLLPLIGPWCLMGGPLVGLSWHFGSKYILRVMAVLLAIFGLEGIGYLMVGWTFFTMVVTASVTYATARVYAPRKGTVKEKKAELKQNNQGPGLSELFDSANSVAWMCIPDGRTLQYIRNLMGIVKDLPTMAKMIGGFWRGLWFDLKNCHAEKCPTFTVYSRKDLRYNILGLSESILMGQLTMVGHTLVYKDEFGVWTKLEVSQLSDIPISRGHASLMNVDNLLWEDDNSLRDFDTATIENASFDVFKRVVVKRTGERMTYDSSVEDLVAHQGVEMDQAHERERIARVAYEKARKAKASKSVLQNLSVAWKDEKKRTEELEKRHKDQKKVAKLARKARLGAPVAPATMPVSLNSVFNFGTSVPAQTFVPPVNVPVAPETRDVGNVVPLKDQPDRTLLGGIEALLASPTKEEKEKEKEDQVHQGVDFHSAFGAGMRFKEYVQTKFVAIRPLWWLIGVGAIIVALAVGVTVYFAKKQRKQAIKKVMAEEQQSTILTYDVDPKDKIVKYYDFAVEKPDWFGYSQERMSRLAAGKEPGQIVPVDVVFSSGKARRVNMIVSDDGQRLQSVREGWEARAPIRVPDDFPKKDLKELGRGTRRAVRPVNGYLRRASAVKEQQGLLNEIAKNPDARKYVVKRHRLNLGLYQYECETKLDDIPKNTFDQTMLMDSEAKLIRANAKKLKAEKKPDEWYAQYHHSSRTDQDGMIDRTLDLGQNKQAVGDVFVRKEIDEKLFPLPGAVQDPLEVVKAHQEYVKSTEGEGFPQSAQAFRTVAASKHIYAVMSKSENNGHVVKLQNGLWMPRHYTDSNMKISDIPHGMSVSLANPMGAERTQQIIWEKNNIVRVPDMWDGAYMPLPKRYDHMARCNKLKVLPDGIHWLWINGLHPDTGMPFMNRVECTKVGNKIHYRTPNMGGICGSTLSEDQDQLVVVGMHCTGNTSSEECTASAVTKGLIALAEKPVQGF